MAVDRCDNISEGEVQWVQYEPQEMHINVSLLQLERISSLTVSISLEVDVKQYLIHP